jgi:hypothetical protein
MIRSHSIPKLWLLATATALYSTVSTPSLAQEDLEEVVVSGRRELGAVIGDIAPEVQLSAQDIRALGVSNVAELLQALGPQLGSSRGRGGERPVVLVNGVRVSGFGEIRDLPSEAILRTDILPEEVALKYGFRADQRVVNIVLRPRFRAFTAEANARDTTTGGRSSADVNGNWLRIQRDERLQLDLKLRSEERLLESERRIVAADGAARPDAPYRTLVPEVEAWTANAVWSKPLGEGRSTTINASFDRNERLSLLGLRAEPANDANIIRRNTDSSDAQLAAIYRDTWAGWRWSSTFNADRSESESVTSGEGLSGRTRSDTLDVDLVANGSPLDLPAGELGVTARASIGSRSIDSLSRRFGVERTTQLDRDRREAQLSVDLPLWRNAGEGGRLGNLSANVNVAVEHLSDFGTLDTHGFGLNWNRTRKLRLIASMTADSGAPSMQQLGGAVIVTPRVRTFDFLRGETLDVARIDGGNPELRGDSRRVQKLGFSSRPLDEVDLNVTADFVRTTTDDLIASLPLATAEAQAAFGERFLRDEDGRLLSVDARALNLGRREREELRWSVSLSRPWGPQPEPPFARGGGGGGGGAGGGARPGAGVGGPPAAAGGAAAGPAINPAAQRARMAQIGERMTNFARRGSWQLSFSHTHRLTDTVSLGATGQTLDLLGGAALFDSTGIARDELELQLGGARNGYGGRLVTRWRSDTVARSADNSLEFAELTTVNLRLFADLGLQPIAREYPLLRGTRVSLVVDNVFNERQQVRDSRGETPFGYQRDLLDPQGRVVRISLRKLFLPDFMAQTRPPGRS